MVAERVVSTGSVVNALGDVDLNDEKLENLRAEFEDEVVERIVEQFVGDVAELKKLRQASREAYAEVSEALSIGEALDMTADGGLEVKSLNLGVDTQMDPCRVFKSVVAGIGVSEHLKKRGFGFTPGVVPGCCHAQLCRETHLEEQASNLVEVRGQDETDGDRERADTGV